MRTLILPLALIVACGGAMADEVTAPRPVVPKDWQGYVDDQLSRAKAAAEKVTLDGDPLSSHWLRVATPILDKALREDVGAPSPCHIGPTPPVPVVYGNQLNAPLGSCNVAVGLWALQDATTMNGTVAFGRCSGATLRTESRDLLIGDYTAAPRGVDGFVNVENKWCWMKDTGERVACPPPEPECAGSK